MAQHLVVSCFIMRMPESAISKLVREVGEKWEDAHGRLMVKVLGHAAVGLEPQWTNDSKSVNKVENKACSGRVCKCARLGRPTCGMRTSDGHYCLFICSRRTHLWCGFNADKTAFLLPEASRGPVATCLGKQAAAWDGVVALRESRAFRLWKRNAVSHCRMVAMALQLGDPPGPVDENAHVSPGACGKADCPPLHSRDAPECVLSRVCGLEPLHHFTSLHDT